MLKAFDTETVEKCKKAREERRGIVQRYDLGRQEGAEIDQWEDPKYEIYHMQDRFGFIHDQRLPETEGRSAREQKVLEKEMSRVDKWLVMIKEKDKWFNTRKLAERVWKGIPERLRGEAWRILLNVEKLKSEHEGEYEKMKNLARLYSKEVRQIDLDVNRTYRDHIMFRERYNTKQQELFHVLAAYSMYNSEVSYCQGMSQVAALLLMYLTSEEDAFWALHQLMTNQNYNMHAAFIPSFPKLQRFQELHDKILLRKLKKVQKHLLSNGMDTGIYSIKWFLQCFLDRIPFSLTLRVWDVFLLEGDSIIPAMAFNILKLHQKTLLKMDMERLMEFLQKSLPEDFGYEDDVTMESLKDCLDELRSSKLITRVPLPNSELPQKKFGSFDADEYEIDLKLEEGSRSAVTDNDRQFLKNTLQREMDIILKLRHIDSQDGLDEDDEDEEDESLSLSNSASFEGDLSDRSLQNDDPTPPPVQNRPGAERNISKTISWKTLDDSLEYLLQQADISGGGGGAAGSNMKTKHITFVEPVRPASAGPFQSKERREKTEEKRKSAIVSLTDTSQLPPSQPQPLPLSSSSREINISSDSQRSSQHHSRTHSKSSYYFGETPILKQPQQSPDLRPRPRSRYVYGTEPDLQEILHNCKSSSPKLPEKLLTQEHNLKLLASAGANSPSPSRSITRSSIPRPLSDKHKTFSVQNSHLQTKHLRSASERPLSQTSRTHRATQDIFVSDYQHQRSESTRHTTFCQVYHNSHSQTETEKVSRTTNGHQASPGKETSRRRNTDVWQRQPSRERRKPRTSSNF